jgi:tRNA pseudouridine38-40 synthase
VKERTRITASGRTDSGVHALGQVVHFDTESDINLSRLCIGLNGILPAAISVTNAFEVPADFHARFSALEREYLYLVHNHPFRSPFMMYRAAWLSQPADCAVLKKALACLKGEHDFASFCKKISAEKGTVREIKHISVTERESLFIVRIRANAFLHNMIRIIMGTLFEIVRKGHHPSHMKKVLEARDRDAAGPTAPPYGLYLYRVYYDPPLEGFPSALEERRTRYAGDCD